MPDRVMVIVPRSAPALYNYLREKFAGDPSVSVVQDRRRTQRREGRGKGPSERRRTARRHPFRAQAIVVDQREGGADQ